MLIEKRPRRLHARTFILAVMAELTIVLPSSFSLSGVRQSRDPNLFRNVRLLQVPRSYRVVAETRCLLSEGSLRTPCGLTECSPSEAWNTATLPTLSFRPRLERSPPFTGST